MCIGADALFPQEHHHHQQFPHDARKFIFGLSSKSLSIKNVPKKGCCCCCKISQKASSVQLDCCRICVKTVTPLLLYRESFGLVLHAADAFDLIIRLQITFQAGWGFKNFCSTDAVWIEMVRMLKFLLWLDQESGNLMLKAAIGFWFYSQEKIDRRWTLFCAQERMALRSREIRMTQTADIKPFWLEEDGATLYNDLCIHGSPIATTLDIVVVLQCLTQSICLSDSSPDLNRQNFFLDIYVPSHVLLHIWILHTHSLIKGHSRN